MPMSESLTDAALLEAAVAGAGGLLSLSGETLTVNRPILSRRDKFTLAGRGATLKKLGGHDGIVLAPDAWLPDPALHFPIDPASGRPAFRTLGNAGLVFWGTGINRPRLSASTVGYDSVRRLQVSLWLRRHTPSWRDFSGLAICGMRGPENNHPGPFYLGWHSDSGLRLEWRDSTGVDHVGPVVPYPDSPEPEYLEITLYMDLAAGAWSSVANDIDQASGSFQPGLYLESGRAAVGILASGLHDNGHVGPGPDQSYLAMVCMANAPMRILNGGEWFNGQPAWFFSTGGDAPQGQFVKWWGSQGWGHGLLVRHVEDDAGHRCAEIGITDLAITGSDRYGAGVCAWPVDTLRIRGLRTQGGAFSVTQPSGPLNSYWTQIADLSANHPDHAAGWFDRSAVHLAGLNVVRYAGEHVLRGRAINLIVDQMTVAVSGSSKLLSLVELNGCGRSFLRNITPNLEGAPPPTRGYYLADPTDDHGAGDSIMEIQSCGAQGAGPVRALVLSGSPATGRRAYYRIWTPLVDDPLPPQVSAGWTEMGRVRELEERQQPSVN